MTLPARVFQAVRPEASPGVLGGAAVVAAIFAATPFLLPDVAARMNVPIGVTGLLSTAQVGSFSVAAFLAGRLFRPRRRYHYGALLLAALSGLLSALAPNFAVLVGARVVAGLGMGTLTWISWADATRFSRGIGDVAAVGPVTAAIASPILGWLVSRGGYPWVYGALGVLALGAVALRVDFGDLPRVGRNVSGSRSNRLLLAALVALTAGGSAVFIFSGATAQAVQGLSPLAVSIAYSINAIAGVVATRFHSHPGAAALWLTGTSLSALGIGILANQVAFFVIMAFWGFAFWMGVPAVFRLLAERSLHPNERVGDAQALMALGRVGGPLIGGAALGIGGYAALSAVGAGVIALGCAGVGVVEAYRRRA
jgi:DHA1 family inner membrane transport protein